MQEFEICVTRDVSVTYTGRCKLPNLEQVTDRCHRSGFCEPAPMSWTEESVDTYDDVEAYEVRNIATGEISTWTPDGDWTVTNPTLELLTAISQDPNSPYKAAASALLT